MANKDEELKNLNSEAGKVNKDSKELTEAELDNVAGGVIHYNTGNTSTGTGVGGYGFIPPSSSN